MGSADDQLYASKAYMNDVALGARTIQLSSGDAAATATAAAAFPEGVKTGSAFDGAFGYVNLDSGWASATRGIEMLMSRVIALGGKVMGGKAVTGLIRPDGGGDGDGDGGDKPAMSGAAISRKRCNASARSGSAPGNCTVCGFLCTPLVRYS